MLKDISTEFFFYFTSLVYQYQMVFCANVEQFQNNYTLNINYTLLLPVDTVSRDKGSTGVEVTQQYMLDVLAYFKYTSPTLY